VNGGRESNVNIPNYASAIVITNEVVEAIAAVA